MEKMYLMCEDTCLQEISYDRKKKQVKINRLVENNMFAPFQNEDPSWEDFVEYLEIERCLPSGRINLSRYLLSLGLERYDAFDIVRATNGAMANNPIWIRFDGDMVTWENDIKKRVVPWADGSGYGADLLSCNDKLGSKGCQEKYRDNKGIWLKTDYYGYEGLSEVLVCRFLKELQIPCVEYLPCDANFYNGVEARGCYSNSFLPKGYYEVTLYALLCRNHIKQMRIKGWLKKSISERMNLIKEAIPEIEEPVLFKYLAQLTVCDAMTYNGDRHLNNILFFGNGRELLPAPIFDNGDALFSDEAANPLDLAMGELKKKVRAKPFSTNFRKQVDYFKAKTGFSVAGKEVSVTVSDLATTSYTAGEMSRAMRALKVGAAGYGVVVSYS